MSDKYEAIPTKKEIMSLRPTVRMELRNRSGGNYPTDFPWLEQYYKFLRGFALTLDEDSPGRIFFFRTGIKENFRMTYREACVIFDMVNQFCWMTGLNDIGKISDKLEWSWEEVKQLNEA
jgi:hypothetical protein